MVIFHPHPSSHEFHPRVLDARAYRGLTVFEITSLALHVTNAPVRSAACTLARWVGVLARASARVACNLAAEGRQRIAISALQRLDDRTLADIGVPRGEIEFVVRSAAPARSH